MTLAPHLVHSRGLRDNNLPCPPPHTHTHTPHSLVLFALSPEILHSPARIFLYASSPLATPPQPTSGTLPPVRRYRSDSAAVDSGNSGGPDRPPASWAAGYCATSPAGRGWGREGGMDYDLERLVAT